MPQPSDMKGRAALVTGSAGGLGRATAIKLAEAGADVFLVDLNAAGLEETAGLARALGVKAVAHPTDLSVRENCPAAVAAAVAAFGRLDALCNVAGVFMPSPTTEMLPGEFEKTLAVNLAAPFYLIQAAIPHLLETHGAVVNVTSCAGVAAQAYSAAYGGTKAALNYMTRSMAVEYVNQPIRFNAVAPGGMATNVALKANFKPGMDMSLFQRISPLRGMVDIEQVAEMTAFLASDASSSYHGAIIAIDNGITAG